MGLKECLTKFYWFELGLWISFQRHILWVAAEDILAGSLYSTSIVLVVFTVPDILSKAIISPWFVERSSFLPAFVLYLFMSGAVEVIFVFVNDVNVRLAGLCVLGLTNGLGTITAAKLLGFYSQSAGVYESGNNMGSVFASILYTGLSTWACVSPRITIAILSPLALFPLLIYVLLDKEPLKVSKNSIKEITYQPLDNEDENIKPMINEAENKRSKTASIGWRFKPLFAEFLVIYYFGATNCLVHLTMTSILSTVTFKSSPFPPRDHYQYYRFLVDFGQMLGGLEVGVVSFFCPRFLETVTIHRIWIVILLNVCHVVVFLTVSWFHYTDNVYIIFILCFTFGVTAGCAYVQFFSLTAELFTDSRKLGVVLGYLEVSASVFRLVAGLLGMFLETYLREHCEHGLLLGQSCLARLPSTKMWTTSNC